MPPRFQSTLVPHSLFAHIMSFFGGDKKCENHKRIVCQKKNKIVRTQNFHISGGEAKNCVKKCEFISFYVRVGTGLGLDWFVVVTGNRTFCPVTVTREREKRSKTFPETIAWVVKSYSINLANDSTFSVLEKSICLSAVEPSSRPPTDAHSLPVSETSSNKSLIKLIWDRTTPRGLITKQFGDIFFVSLLKRW